jgi:uroporphyrin-III C-methyltransferase/precorrin-2 dehydrogenase/sirohydrochlorin ferrochelatase
VLSATLATMPDILAKHTIESPALLIVGDVARLHDRLKWFRPDGSIVNGGEPAPDQDGRDTVIAPAWLTDAAF